MFKFFHIMASLLFFTMAAIQLNDPDPLYWVVAYLTAAIIAGGLCFGKRQETLSKVSMGMILAGLLMSGPGAMEYFASGDYGSIYGSMLAAKPYVESAREFGGLLIAFIYLALFEGNMVGFKTAKQEIKQDK